MLVIVVLIGVSLLQAKKRGDLERKAWRCDEFMLKIKNSNITAEGFYYP